jgi:D-galactarolactone cycloisomerase
MRQFQVCGTVKEDSMGSSIERVETFALEHELPDGGYGASKIRPAARTATLVKVTTTEGVVGWGESFGPPRLLTAYLRDLADLVIGQPVELREGTWLRALTTGYHLTTGGPRVAAMSGLDIAMWDAAARTYGVSLSALLGGRVRDSVQAYASTAYFTSRDGLDSLRESIQSAVSEGYTAAKIKIGAGVTSDVSRVAAARELLGPDRLLMVDYNGNATVDTVLSSLARIREFDLYWVEEPLPPDDALGWAMVRDAGVPLAAGEALYTRFGFRDYIAQKRIDIVQPNLSVCGGITEAKVITQMATAFNLRVSPHVWGTGVLMAATLQLIATLPDTPFGERNGYPVILEFDQGENPYREGVLTQPITAIGGDVEISQAPGIGVDVNEDFVRGNALAAHSIDVRR